jgi:hypothetical protein
LKTAHGSVAQRVARATKTCVLVRETGQAEAAGVQLAAQEVRAWISQVEAVSNDALLATDLVGAGAGWQPRRARAHEQAGQGPRVRDALEAAVRRWLLCGREAAVGRRVWEKSRSRRQIAR